MAMTYKYLCANLLGAALSLSALAVPQAAHAKSWVETLPANERTQASVTKGSPIVMRTETAFSDILVADSGIADVVVLTDRSFHVTGKESGKTNIMLYDTNKRLIDIVDVNVGHDLAALKKGLYETFPSERIEVRPMAGGVYLAGKVSTGRVAEQAYRIAQRFAPDNVTNGLVVKDSHQVSLQVRFVEASREAIKDLGIGLFVQGSDGALVTRNSVLSGTPNATAVISDLIDSASVDLTINALEESGLVRTLAEPNLVAMSGETASFLAGGEFPVPVPGDNGTITIDYRQFGVSLAFTPTVLDDGIINLKVAPEVSQLDFSNPISTGGVAVPSLTVRRANTTVELRNDQSFAIAGLLQNSRTDNKSQVPWLGDVPILGALFRSSRYKNEETELVILITPKLVHPLEDISQARTPLDGQTAPSEAAQFLLGKLEGPNNGPAGEFAGSYGHVLQ